MRGSQRDAAAAVEVGSLSITKTVLGTPAGDPVPTSYNVHVVCDGDQVDDVFELAAGETTTIDNLLDGTNCTVNEEGTDTFATGTDVRYTPAGVDTEGVEIETDTTTDVTVINDFTGVEGEVVSDPPVRPGAGRSTRCGRRGSGLHRLTIRTQVL